MGNFKIKQGTSLTNRFNKETFIFHQGIEGVEADSFTVVLEAGGSGGGNALEHIHPQAAEHFFVRRGAIVVSVDGVKHMIPEGEGITVPPGRPHYFQNAVDGTTELVIRFSPAGKQMKFFGNFAALCSERPEWFHPDGRPHLLLMALKLSAFSGCLYLAGKPIWLQKLVFGMLSTIAKMRGYKMLIRP